MRRWLLILGFLGGCLWFWPTVSLAQEYTIKTMTPEIDQALQSRRDRYARLAELKSQGAVGENNRGYAEVLSGAEAKSLVDAENKDRRIIYRAITEQNGLGADALSTVEKVFAQVQQEKARAGEKIQAEDGRWIAK